MENLHDWVFHARFGLTSDTGLVPRKVDSLNNHSNPLLT